jgi:hypothetical protein
MVHWDMGRALLWVFRRHFFLLIGLLAIGLFYLLGELQRTGHFGAARALAGPIIVFLTPEYWVWGLVRRTELALFKPNGLTGLPDPLRMAIFAVAGLAPYALTDYVLGRLRKSMAGRRLAKLGGTQRDLADVPRRRSG